MATDTLTATAVTTAVDRAIEMVNTATAAVYRATEMVNTATAAIDRATADVDRATADVDNATTLVNETTDLDEATETTTEVVTQSTTESKLVLDGMLKFIGQTKEWKMLIKLEEHGALVITEDLFFNQLGIKLSDWKDFKDFPKFLVIFLNKKSPSVEEKVYLREIFSNLISRSYRSNLFALNITEDLIFNQLDIKTSEWEKFAKFPEIFKILLLRELQTVTEAPTHKENLSKMFPSIFAQKTSDLGLAQEVLNCGIDLNSNNCGIKAIDYTFKNDNLEAFEFLLKAGVTINNKLWKDCYYMNLQSMSNTGNTRHLIIKYHTDMDELNEWFDESYGNYRSDDLYYIVKQMIKDQSESKSRPAPVPDKKMYYAIQFNEYPNINFPGFLIFTEGGKWYCGIELTEFVDDFVSKSAILATIGISLSVDKPGFYLL